MQATAYGLKVSVQVPFEAAVRDRDAACGRLTIVTNQERSVLSRWANQRPGGARRLDEHAAYARQLTRRTKTAKVTAGL
jgi:hypothetical protein